MLSWLVFFTLLCSPFKSKHILNRFFTMVPEQNMNYKYQPFWRSGLYYGGFNASFGVHVFIMVALMLFVIGLQTSAIVICFIRQYLLLL